MPPRTGALNKSKERLWKALRKEYGDDFDPIVEMSSNALFLQYVADEYQAGFKLLYESLDGAIESVGDEVFQKVRERAVDGTNEAIEAWNKVAPYLAAKYQAIVFQGPEDDEGNPTTVTIQVVKAHHAELSPPNS